MTTVGLRRSNHLKSEKKKCYSTIKNIGFIEYCAFATMTTAVRRQIETMSASRYYQNLQRAHSNFYWTRNVCQPMARITAMIVKYTWTYWYMKQQPDKPQFITEMQKEISDHKKSKHWKLFHRSETKGAKRLWQFGPSGEKGTKSLERWKIQSHNLCARWNAGERNKLLGNVCPSSAIDER